MTKLLRFLSPWRGSSTRQMLIRSATFCTKSPAVTPSSASHGIPGTPLPQDAADFHSVPKPATSRSFATSRFPPRNLEGAKKTSQVQKGIFLKVKNGRGQGRTRVSKHILSRAECQTGQCSACPLPVCVSPVSPAWLCSLRGPSARPHVALKRFYSPKDRKSVV